MSDAPEPRHTFPPRLRLKSPAQFKAVYDLKKSASDARLVVYAGPNGLAHPRLGLSVSRKVGGAVVRNRFKRLFREAFRLAQYELPGGVDLVLIPRSGDEPTLDQVKGSLVKLAHQAAKRLGTKPGLPPLPPSPASGEGRGGGRPAAPEGTPPPRSTPLPSPPPEAGGGDKTTPLQVASVIPTAEEKPT